MVGNFVQLQIKVGDEAEYGKVEVSQLSQSDDWVIVDNMHLGIASLSSEQEDQTINISPKFKKADVRLPPAPSDDWGIDQRDWPEAMRKRTSRAASAAGSVADEAAVQETPKKKPKGSGKAKGSPTE